MAKLMIPKREVFGALDNREILLAWDMSDIFVTFDKTVELMSPKREVFVILDNSKTFVVFDMSEIFVIFNKMVERMSPKREVCVTCDKIRTGRDSAQSIIHNGQLVNAFVKHGKTVDWIGTENPDEFVTVDNKNRENCQIIRAIQKYRGDSI
jgi:hypothetical protein